MSHRFRISLLIVTLITAFASHAVAQNPNDAVERQTLRLETEAREATIMTGQEKKERSQSGGEDEVRLIHKVDAAYPQEAKDKAVEGKVVVELTIDEKGDPIDARVKEGPEPLREAALEAARQARFSNPLKRKFTGTLAYDFRLGGDKGKTSQPAARQAAPKAAAEEPRIKLIERVEPVYPSEAEEKGITGKVTVEITIDEKGEVSEAKVKEGPQELRQAAIDAVRKWRFSNPAKQKVVATIAFNFEP
jgi:TonB family protein